MTVLSRRTKYLKLEKQLDAERLEVALGERLNQHIKTHYRQILRVSTNILLVYIIS